MPAMTWRPLPLPSFAPSIIPAAKKSALDSDEEDFHIRKSRIWIGAPCTFKVPGTVVRVVNSISLTSEWVPVSLVIKVDYRRVSTWVEFSTHGTPTFPTEGNPTNPTDATPVRATSNPMPPPPPPPDFGSISSRRSLASLALSWPKW